MDQHSPDMLPSVEIPNASQGSQAPEYVQSTGSPERSIGVGVERNSVPSGGALPQAQHVMQPQAGAISAAEPYANAMGMTANPQIADDADLIEKEWVDKAKQIVERTKHDPHQQNKEMNLMKADYLKKRYNKDIKLSE